MKIGLVSCSKTKQQGKHPAKELYDSPLFRLAFAYASQHCDKVFILSAKYGLVSPETTIESYDLSLRHMNRREREEWGEAVANAIKDMIRQGDEIYYFCGELYRQHLIGRLSLSAKYHVPLRALPVGKQLQWYKQKQNTPRK